MEGLNQPSPVKPTNAASGNGIKWLFVAVGLVLMVIAAKMYKPPASANAESTSLLRSPTTNPTTKPKQTAGKKTPRQDGELIGELYGRDYRVRIFAGTPEPTYTILSVEGSVLAEGLVLADLPKRFPDLDPAQLHMSPQADGQTPGALMYADPAEGPDR